MNIRQEKQAVLYQLQWTEKKQTLAYSSIKVSKQNVIPNFLFKVALSTHNNKKMDNDSTLGMLTANDARNYQKTAKQGN